METKQIPIYKLHKDVLKDYAENEKKMFLYVTEKVYGEYQDTDMIYNFVEEIFKIKYIDHINIPCDDDLIDFLKPEIIYYKYDYEKETEYDYIKLMEFKVEEMKE